MGASWDFDIIRQKAAYPTIALDLTGCFCKEYYCFKNI